MAEDEPCSSYSSYCSSSSYDSYEDDELALAEEGEEEQVEEEEYTEEELVEEEEEEEGDVSTAAPFASPAQFSVSGKRKRAARRSRCKRQKLGAGDEGGTEWREHHNQQERKRRDTLGGQFSRLAHTLSLPTNASRLLVLSKTCQGLHLMRDAKTALASYERILETANADIDKGLRKSPAIVQALITSFEEDVWPLLCRSMLLDPKKVPEEARLAMQERLFKHRTKGSSSYDAACAVLEQYRSTCALPEEGDEVAGETIPTPRVAVNAALLDEDDDDDADSWTTEDYNFTEEELRITEDDIDPNDPITLAQFYKMQNKAREEVFRGLTEMDYDMAGVEFAADGRSHFVSTCDEESRRGRRSVKRALETSLSARAKIKREVGSEGDVEDTDFQGFGVEADRVDQVDQVWPVIKEEVEDLEDMGQEDGVLSDQDDLLDEEEEDVYEEEDIDEEEDDTDEGDDADEGQGDANEGIDDADEGIDDANEIGGDANEGGGDADEGRDVADEGRHDANDLVGDDADGVVGDDAVDLVRNDADEVEDDVEVVGEVNHDDVETKLEITSDEDDSVDGVGLGDPGRDTVEMKLLDEYGVDVESAMWSGVAPAPQEDENHLDYGL